MTKTEAAVSIVIDAEKLKGAVARVESLARLSVGVSPMTRNLLIRQTGNRLEIVSTNLAAMASVTVPDLPDHGTFETTVDAAALKQIIADFSGAVEMEERAGKISIRNGFEDFKLPTLPAEDFPAWHRQPETEPAKACSFVVDAYALASAVDCVRYAIPKKDHRRVLLGAFFEVVDTRPDGTASILLWGTCGKKLSCEPLEVRDLTGERTTLGVVPMGELDALNSMGWHGDIAVEFDPRQVSAVGAGAEFRALLIDGKYPDCRAVMPKETPFVYRVPAADLKRMAKKADIVSDKSRAVVLTFRDSAVHFSSCSHGEGTFSGRADATFDCAGVEMAVNAAFLAETIAALGDCEAVEIRAKTANAPLLLCGVGKGAVETPGRVRLVMPIKLSDVRGAAPAEDDAEE